MNLHKLDAANSGPWSPKPLGTPRSAPTTPGEAGGPDPMHRRIENFVERADRRLEHAFAQEGLSKRQVDALRDAQQKFHAQMRRLDRAVDDGSVTGAMDHILAQLRTSMDAILHPDAGPAGGRASATSGNPSPETGHVQRGPGASGIDTLA